MGGTPTRSTVPAPGSRESIRRVSVTRRGLAQRLGAEDRDERPQVVVVAERAREAARDLLEARHLAGADAFRRRRVGRCPREVKQGEGQKTPHFFLAFISSALASAGFLSDHKMDTN